MCCSVNGRVGDELGTGAVGLALGGKSAVVLVIGVRGGDPEASPPNALPRP